VWWAREGIVTTIAPLRWLSLSVLGIAALIIEAHKGSAVAHHRLNCWSIAEMESRFINKTKMENLGTNCHDEYADLFSHGGWSPCMESGGGYKVAERILLVMPQRGESRALSGSMG
jgi:hypothetical protein